jgi:hypothetical protein
MNLILSLRGHSINRDRGLQSIVRFNSKGVEIQENEFLRDRREKHLLLYIRNPAPKRVC